VDDVSIGAMQVSYRARFIHSTRCSAQ